MDERIIIRQMREFDIPSAMDIKNDEGWYQVEDDWKLLIRTSPEWCLVAELGAEVVGTITSINYENKIAWIGMMLVRKEYRAQGISKFLMKSVLEKLKGVEKVKLDATPAGLKVYERIGVSADCDISRLVRMPAYQKNHFPHGARPGTNNKFLSYKKCSLEMPVVT